MISWMLANKEWVFSGVGVLIITGLVAAIRWFLSSRNDRTIGAARPEQSAETNASSQDPAAYKVNTHILFIDDDQKFKVVDILKKSGWTYTKRVGDIGSLDDSMIQQAQILFIDIIGVGRRLQFKDEGLGLAAAIKGKYPGKKVVIYSTETKGDRFHDALRKVDDFLAKNADPYEFQQITERLALDLQKGL